MKDNKKYAVEFPCPIGTLVYYLTNHPLEKSYIRCVVDKYEVTSSSILVHVSSIDENNKLDTWLDTKQFDELTRTDIIDLLNKDIQLYMAIASYDLKDAEGKWKFEITNVPIQNIDDDGTIVTKYMYAVSRTTITDKFSDRKGNLDTELKIDDCNYVMYSTDEDRCIAFLMRHTDKAECKLTELRQYLDTSRQKYQKEVKKDNAQNHTSDTILDTLRGDIENLKKSAYENKNFERLTAFKQCEDIICKYANADSWIPVENDVPRNQSAVLVVLESTDGTGYREYSVARYLYFETYGESHWCDSRYGYLKWDKYSENHGGCSMYKVIAWKLIEPYTYKG